MPELTRTIAAPLARVRDAIEPALKGEGFGILTEVDIQATFRAKLGAEHEGHRILGVCNPVIAKQALDIDRDVALLLPCTITLREVPEGTLVQVLDPALAFTLTSDATQQELEPHAVEVAGRLSRALAAIDAGA
jgi:uncharacterized protein (DUF302 family)